MTDPSSRNAARATVLVDTSVWIEVFRRDRPLDLATHVELERVGTCLPVVQEVLQGFREDSGHRLARRLLMSVARVEDPMRLDVVEEAVSLYRSARRLGFSVRSSADCLIAACALRNDLEVLHRNRDFTMLARVSGLRQRRI